MNKLFNDTVRTSSIILDFVEWCYFEVFLGVDSYENARNNTALVCVFWVCIFLGHEVYIYVESDAVLIGNLLPKFRRGLPPYQRQSKKTEYSSNVLYSGYLEDGTSSSETRQETTNQRGFTPKKTGVFLEPDRTHFFKLILGNFFMCRCNPHHPSDVTFLCTSWQFSGCHDHERNTSMTDLLWRKKD
jgi:hypothetical protein